jgi:SAM-dependent methyltransferase
MHEQGWQVTGIDASAAAVQRVREHLGLRALVGSLPHEGLVGAEFDVITLWHSLEHVHDPLNVLRETHRLLAPGGKVVVAVPNIDSRPFHWFGPSWFGLDLPRHLTHFSPHTLCKMLIRAGFAVGPVQMLRHSDWLRSSVKIANRYGRAEPWQRWLRGKPASRLATWYSYLLRQSDCMCVKAYKSVPKNYDAPARPMPK